MTTKKTRNRLFLISCIGFMQWCFSAVDSAKWEHRVSFENMVCPDAIVHSITSLSRTHCCVTCEQIQGCVSIFYTPDGINNCHLANVKVLTKDDCIPEPNARYYSTNDVHSICNEDSQYLTLLLSDGPFTYQVVHVPASVPSAQQVCAASGGFLAKFSTVPRLEIMKEIMTTCAGFDQIGYWVGGTNVYAANYFADDAWTWHDGEVVNMNLTFWGPNRPDHPSTQHCMKIYGTLGWKLTDFYCGQEATYICEK